MEPMQNPWEEIDLADYENHMKLDSVQQLQSMNRMMKGQLSAYPARSVMILGVAGGNGLEHVDPDKFHTVYGVDINGAYLKAVQERYPALAGRLECIQADLTRQTDRLPRAELLIANLLIEYIGYGCFQNAVRQVEPEYVSCAIQINLEGNWVSDSPYIHVFDGLDRVHHQMEEDALCRAMAEIGYTRLARLEMPLPNGKKLIQADFKKAASPGKEPVL